MGVVDISYISLLLFYLLLLVPIALSQIYNLEIIKDTLYAAGRMTIQLGLVGLYLEYVFTINNPWINLLWIFIMMFITNITIIRKAGLKYRTYTPVVFFGILLGTIPVAGTFIFIVIQPEPFYEARYVIPITGMILGNCLRANVISLEHFYSSIRKNVKEYITYLVMGATRIEAVRPFVRQALKPALAPTIATMVTIGLVSLPGMMTGQILGGSNPMVAIKYQIAIMISIFVATIITSLANIYLSISISFNKYEMLKKDIFREVKKKSIKK